MSTVLKLWAPTRGHMQSRILVRRFLGQARIPQLVCRISRRAWRALRTAKATTDQSAGGRRQNWRGMEQPTQPTVGKPKGAQSGRSSSVLDLSVCVGLSFSGSLDSSALVSTWAATGRKRCSLVQRARQESYRVPSIRGQIVPAHEFKFLGFIEASSSKKRCTT